MKKILSAIAVSTILSASLCADMARVEIGAGAWAQTPSGTADYKAGGGVTGTNTFDEKKDTSAYVWMLIKHPIPVVPNIRLEYVSIHATGTATGSWGGVAIPGSSNSVLDIKEYDIIPYYNILDNTFWTTVDLGLDIKVMNMDYTVAKNGLFPGYQDSYTAPIPLLYARVRVEIPTTNIALESDAKYVTTGSSTIYDVRAKIDYTFDISSIVQPALEIGYRTQKIKIDEDGEDVKTDMDFSGFYAGLMLRF
ncbi:TIGR04219 family outer membrane beta-barrel protein [Sulfurimonas sediminis]|uniref:TIGR04219 family outer membrane beta-barrel protein n=1 Tax=Sulfurimonas sediminis TaxID=2590020 RepID=A0A7M1AYK5_9BACT|nr:TIGR04219 family outer membrane beta-barrel protein [Sulfurimonas sediminis]QOP42567.1 TIGR04219 family outer membrane beta-barrel protein [Sulfurimonas sediminis]